MIYTHTSPIGSIYVSIICLSVCLSICLGLLKGVGLCRMASPQYAGWAGSLETQRRLGPAALV